MLLNIPLLEIYLTLTLSMNAMKYVAITLNFDFFRGRGVNQDKRERMVVLVPKFLSLNYSVKLRLEKKKKELP